MTGHNNNWPNESQQRALAYAPKPFAALSFLSSLFAMYYLLVRHPEKRKRMYHRLIRATFVCIMPLSFALFWGTWAMPENIPWAVGASGNSVTCSIQGFIYITFYLAFPFYYASISVFAYVALKNNFKEEKYRWMEKWIHVGAYLPPLTLAIIALVEDWMSPGLAVCTMDIHGECRDYTSPDCHSHEHSDKLYAPIAAIVFIELLVGTFTIIYLIYHFDKIQKKSEDAIGMRAIVEEARKRRLKEVVLQTVLYLISFWFGYIPTLISHFVRVTSGNQNYPLIIFSHCIFGCQGFIILAIYFALQQRSQRKDTTNLVPASPGTETQEKHETVSKIRENAGRRRSVSAASAKSSVLSRFSFRIFDGTPAEDSPWAHHFDGAFTDSGLSDTVTEDNESEHRPQPQTTSSTPLLPHDPPSEDIP